MNLMKMQSFKGTKGKDTKETKYKKLKNKTLEIAPIKPDLPPPYIIDNELIKSQYENELQKSKYVDLDLKKQEYISNSKSNTLPAYTNLSPYLLSETLTLSSGKNINIVKITETIFIIFDPLTGILKEITNMLNDDVDNSYIPQKYNIPIPDTIKWLNKKHIIAKSTKNIGTLLVIKSEEISDEYPECISCILFEKVNLSDNFDIKIIVNLKYEDSHIKQSELLDVIFTNINNFWIIIKKRNDIHLLYYYKLGKNSLTNKSTRHNSDYLYSEFIIKDYTFICSMWTIYDIYPDIIYVVVHDRDKKVSVHQYFIRLDENDIPDIDLYSINSQFHECGDYVSFCANYNISIFSILFELNELNNNVKQFYTGIMALSQLDQNKRTFIKLDFSQKTVLAKETSIIEAQLMIYDIMTKTEESIMKEEEARTQYIFNEKKKYMANKQLEMATKELERREIEAREIADKLLEEEESKKSKIKIKTNKKNIRIEMEKLEKQKKDDDDRVEKEKLMKELLEKEKVEKERLSKERLEKERLEKERVENELIEKDQFVNKKHTQEEFKQVILVKSRLSQKNLEKEKLKKQRLDKERLDKERLEKERLEKERVEKERVEKERLEKERLDKERLEKERLEKERVEKERVEKERLEKERLEQERLEKERLEKERLEKERVDKERLEKERLDKERLEKERVEQERLEKERVEQERLEQERVDTERLEKERLEKERLEKERLEKERLEKETPIKNKKLVLKTRNNRLEYKEKEQKYNIIENIPSNITKPFYYSSNDIDLKTNQHNLYFMFIYYMTMINPIVANELIYSQSPEHYNELLFTHRFYIMYAIDILVIYSAPIIHLKSIIDSQKEKGFTISAIYGSYLPLIYSCILNEIGFIYNAFGQNINDLDKLKDYDTLVLKLLDDYNETHTDTEFIRELSSLIGYNTDGKPVSRTKIQSSSIHNLICHCWDLNYTSAILLYEDYKHPYVMRNPDFTEFLFGQQTIQLLFGKNESNLYNYDITMKRLNKAISTWY
jgi:hypothetical protein